VVILPRDSTPVDFAYTIHTEVGHACTGARVNGRIVPLRYKLRNGEIVEILTQPGHTPSRDWLTFTKSSRARQKIRHWLNVHQRERAMEIGRKLIEKEARKYRVSLKDISNEDYQRVAQEYGVARADDLIAGIGFGKFSVRQVLGKLSPAQTGAAPKEEEAGIGSVVRRVFGGDSGTLKVKGQDDLLIYRARCCNPIRGEEIVGYVTRGKGVAVHAKSCPNVVNLLYDVERQIAVEWGKDTAAGDGTGTYPVKLTVFCDDRAGMLKQITTVISDDNTNIRNVEARTGEGHATIDVVVEIADMKHLQRIVGGIRKLAGIRDVQRVQKL
jgi:GTP pyrophosphokinase